MPRAEIDGWVTNDTKNPSLGVPRKCPKCGGRVSKTDAQRLLGYIFVWCNGTGHKIDLPCRWCDFYYTQ